MSPTLRSTRFGNGESDDVVDGEEEAYDDVVDDDDGNN